MVSARAIVASVKRFVAGVTSGDWLEPRTEWDRGKLDPNRPQVASTGKVERLPREEAQDRFSTEIQHWAREFLENRMDAYEFTTSIWYEAQQFALSQPWDDRPDILESWLRFAHRWDELDYARTSEDETRIENELKAAAAEILRDGSPDPEQRSKEA
jgi:hypothetical protein